MQTPTHSQESAFGFFFSGSWLFKGKLKQFHLYRYCMKLNPVHSNKHVVLYHPRLQNNNNIETPTWDET